MHAPAPNQINMDWTKTNLTEPELRAISIYNTLGPIDGHVHILQLRYFCEDTPFETLIKYWKEVEIVFKTIRKKENININDWL